MVSYIENVVVLIGDRAERVVGLCHSFAISFF